MTGGIKSMGRPTEKGWERLDSHPVIAELVEENMVFFSSVMFPVC